MSTDQAGFDFGSGRRRPRKVSERFRGSNLFIVARPGAGTAAEAQAIARDMRDQYRIDRQPLATRRLHISLISLGRHDVLPDSEVFDARAAIDAVRFQPIDIILDHVLSLRSDASYPVVLAASDPNHDLQAIVGQLADRLAGLGVPFDRNPDPLIHMTLVYHDKPITPEQIAVPVRCRVDRVWLIHSLLGKSSYEFLWPLDDELEAA